MKKFRWAYLGCGSIAHTTAKELKKSPENEIVAVWNRTRKKADEFVKKYGGTVYDTAEEAINAPGVDGVYIALTPNQHEKYVKLCIEKNKPVLCEKPYAVNLEQVDRLIALSKEKKVYASEAMWTWHNDVAYKVKEWLQEGKIGTIKQVQFFYSFPLLKFSKNQAIIDANRVAGALMEIGIYGIRYSVELFGKPDSVICEGKTENGVDIRERILLKYEDFSVEIVNDVDGKMNEKLVVRGTDGVITVPYFHQAWEATLQNSKGKEKFSDNSKRYEKEFTNTGREIKEGLLESKFVSVENTRETFRILDECRRQLGVVFPCERMNEDIMAGTGVKMISHLGFNCKDIQEAIQFYRDIMGCKIKFTLDYNDLARSVIAEAEAEGKKAPGYAKYFQKMGNKLWSVYMEWSEGCFIELFDQIGASRKRVPGNHDLNYTHFALEVEDIHAVQNAIITRGGAKYIENAITMGADGTWTLWIHDPDGNRFELMEYTKDSLQITGRKTI